MSTSQVIVNVDTKLKNQAMKKAKQDGIPFSVVLRKIIELFAKGRINVELVEDFNWKTRREIKASLRDIKKGKNLSPAFSTADEMIDHLRK